MMSMENKLELASFELLAKQLEHEERLCDGAQHLLESKETDDDLRASLSHEILQSNARAALIRKQIHVRWPESRLDGRIADLTGMRGAEGEQHSNQTFELLGTPSLWTRKGNEEGNSDAISRLKAILENLAENDHQDVTALTNNDERASCTAMADDTRQVSDLDQTRAQISSPVNTSGKRLAQRNRSFAHSLSKSQHGRTPSNANGVGAANSKRIALLSRAIAIVRDNVRSRYQCPVSSLDGIFRCLSDAAGKELRASTYRLLRYFVVRPPWTIVDAYRAKGLDLFLTRTFLRDSRFSREKEEALKLIRRMIDCGNSSAEPAQSVGTPESLERKALLSSTVVRALAAAADSTEEPIKHLCLETLAEIALYDIELLSESGGLRILLSYIADPSSRLGPEILSICLHLLDLPRTRRFFDPRCDVLSIFTGFITPSNSHLDSLRGTADAACSILRSWSGLLYVCSDGGSVIKALLESLRVNSPEAQGAILNMLIELLTHDPATALKDSSTPSQDHHFHRSTKASHSVKYNVCDSYLLLLTTILLDNGLLNVLLHLLEADSHLTTAAMRLLQKISDNAKDSLPPDYIHRIHALPDVFHMRFMGKCDDGVISERERASSIFSSLEAHSFQYHSQRQLLQQRTRSSSAVTQLRPKAQVDDTTFRTLLLEANVLSNKDFAKWNVDALQSLFESVLVNGKRLEEAMRASKLVRRVLSFFHPFAMRFSATANTTSNLRFVKLGCTVIETLLMNREGARFLGEDQLLKEIGECINTDVMSEQRYRDTLVSGYFDMLGVLSKKAEGRQLMAQANIYTALFRLLDRRVRIDMARSMLSSIDFSSEGQSRLLLSRTMSAHSRTLRSLAIRKIYDMAITDPRRWLVFLLVNALYDTVTENRDLASSLLLQACTQSDKILEMVVAMQPKLDQCLHSLFLKFLSTDRGFWFLKQGDYIDREMEEWYNYRNVLYSSQLEAKTMMAFDVQAHEDQRRWDGYIPPHFYGELVKTRDGCQLLESSGHLSDFIRFVRTHAAEDSDNEIVQKVKSILWALAHIGTSVGGLPLLEREDVIGQMIWIAEHSCVISLRGVSFFALNLIASTEAGAELIQDAGWNISTSTDTKLTGVYAICMPSQAFLSLPSWSVWRSDLPPPSTIESSDTKVGQLVLKHIAGLGNTIIAAKASKSLSRLKKRHPALFRVQSTAIATGMDHDRRTGHSTADRSNDIGTSDAQVLFVQALHLLNSRPFRQSIRRFVWDLFEVKLDATLVGQLSSIRETFERSAIPHRTAAQQSLTSNQTTAALTSEEAKAAAARTIVQDFDATDESESDDSDEAIIEYNEESRRSTDSVYSRSAYDDEMVQALSDGAQDDDVLHRHRKKSLINNDVKRPPVLKRHLIEPKKRVVGGFSNTREDVFLY